MRKERRVRYGKGFIWTPGDDRLLRIYSNLQTRVSTIAREMRRSPSALRYRAHQKQIPLGHQRQAD
jgi:hypothetical protein